MTSLVDSISASDEYISAMRDYNAEVDREAARLIRGGMPPHRARKWAEDNVRWRRRQQQSRED